MFRLTEADRHHPLGTDISSHRLPSGRTASYLLPYLSSHTGIGQVAIEVASSRHPWWEEGGESGAGPNVRVHIGRHIDSRCASVIDPPDHVGHLMPVFPSGSFEMIDLHRQICPATDFKRLTQGI